MDTITVSTSTRTQLLDITYEVRRWLAEQDVESGVLTLFVPHTTAGITINESADPDVPRDLLMELNKVIPFEDGYHHMEGNSAAHIKSSLVGCSIQIPVEDGGLVLGTWQGVFFAEFDGPRRRKLHLQLVGSQS